MRKDFKDILMDALLAPNPVREIRDLAASGRLRAHLPELADVADMDTIGHKDVWEHSLGVMAKAHLSDRVRAEASRLGLDESDVLFRERLSSLLHDVGKPATRTLSDAWASRYESAWAGPEWSWDTPCSRAWWDTSGGAWDAGLLDAWRSSDRARFNNHEQVGANMVDEALLRLGFEPAFARTVAIDVACTGFHYGIADLSLEDRGGRVKTQAVERAVERLGGRGPWASLNLAIRFDIISWDATGRRADRHRDAVQAVWRAIDEVERLRAEEEAARIANLPPLDGHDIMSEFGVGPGPWIGRAIAAQRNVLARGETLTREDAVILVRAVLDDTP